MRTLTIAILILAASLPPSFAANATSLVELLEQGKVKLQPVGLGGHSGDCLRVDVHNASSTAISTSIPPGWIFVSESNSVQDLLVVREEVLALQPGANWTVTCRAFCCEASMGGPGHDEAYLKGHPAPEKLFALAQVINKGHYDDDVVQNAIWVLSDGHDINSTGALDGSATDTLRNHLSALSGQPAPRYLVRYAPDGVRASSNRPETISRTISMDFANASNLMVLVKRDDGRIMEILHDQLPIGPGGFDLPLSVHVLTWPKGRYAFYVYTTETNSVRRLPFVL